MKGFQFFSYFEEREFFFQKYEREWKHSATNFDKLMHNVRLPTSFQLSIFIFEAEASFKLYSKMQIANKSVREFLRQIFKLKKYAETE